MLKIKKRIKMSDDTHYEAIQLTALLCDWWSARNYSGKPSGAWRHPAGALGRAALAAVQDNPEEPVPKSIIHILAEFLLSDLSEDLMEGASNCYTHSARTWLVKPDVIPRLGSLAHTAGLVLTDLSGMTSTTDRYNRWLGLPPVRGAMQLEAGDTLVMTGGGEVLATRRAIGSSEGVDSQGLSFLTTYVEVELIGGRVIHLRHDAHVPVL